MPTPPESRRRQRHWLIVTIALLWLSAVSYGFWHYDWQWQSRFEDSHASFGLSTQLPPPNSFSPGEPLVVHFVDSQCPCTRFATPHIEALDARFDPSVRTMRIYATDSQAKNFAWLPASPAVAIWDGQGKLAYLGPHSDGAFCGQGDDLVARVMQQLSAGNNPQWLNREAIGCFCPWRV